MLGADFVREIVARRAGGEGVKRIARELGVDRKTVRRWLRVGGWQRRRHRPGRRTIYQFTEFVAQRGRWRGTLWWCTARRWV